MEHKTGKINTWVKFEDQGQIKRYLRNVTIVVIISIKFSRHMNTFLISNDKCSSIDCCMKYFNDLQLDLNRLKDMPYGRAKRLVLNTLV
jgi:hypothetical protein